MCPVPAEELSLVPAQMYRGSELRVTPTPEDPNLSSGFHGQLQLCAVPEETHIQTHTHIILIEIVLSFPSIMP